ncbi:MAG: class D sortase [Anaerolineales bacterium]|nr:class D sortase [Anaerolineales bacterium]MCW5855250.1 class D sortase [Anaerolineales bacterium]
MGRNNPPELSESELRRQLLERRRADRARRLQRFSQDGELAASQAAAAEPPQGDPLNGPQVHPAPGLRLASGGPSRLDRTLLVVEILAVLGLVYIFFNGLSVLDNLNKELSAAFQLGGEASAAPIIGPVVLPSGHTPPGQSGAARPNEAEIPEHLRPQMQAYLASLQAPTPGPEQALGIRIERIGVNAPVVLGDDWEALKRGVGQHIGSANPGQTGNLVLSGHNDIYGEVFRHLDELQPGDEIVIFTASRTYTYKIVETRIVAPTAVEVLAPTPQATLTLISCYPYRVDTQRIVVIGELSSN